MNENDHDVPASDEPPTTPMPPTPPTPPMPPPPAADAVPPAPKQRWRDRVFGVRSTAAVALAGLIVGAGAGTGITLLADGGGHDDRDIPHFDRMDGPGRHGDFDGWGPGGGPGQGPPGDSSQGSSQSSSQGSTNPTS